MLVWNAEGVNLGKPLGPYAVLMAGQLSERAGMASPLASHPVFRRLAGGFDNLTAGQFERWVTTARQEEISERFTAPAVMVLYDIVCGEAAVRDWGPPAAVAGYSLGFYAAAAVARCVSPQAVLGWLTRVNADNARRFATGRFCLAVVTGLAPEAVRERLDGWGLSGVRVANLNNPAQVVVAGPAAEVRRGLEALRGSVLDAKELPFDVPLHTDYMDGTRGAVAGWWSLVPASAPIYPLLSPVSGERLTSGAAFKHHMLQSLAAPTDWTAVARTLERMGVEWALDVSPGGELGRMTRWTHRGLRVLPVSALWEGPA